MSIHRNIRRIAVTAMVGTTLVAGIHAPSAFADDANVVVTGGSLGITTAPLAGNFAGVTLDGTAKTTTASFDNFEVNDARGSGDGWNVTVQATTMAEHDGSDYVASGKTLPADSLSLATATVVADGTTSGAPTMTAGSYSLTTSAVKIASAAVDAGMGKYDISFAGTNADLTLSVPSNAYAKTYRSDLTLTLASTP
ncbi:MAG TPA: WxL domain-containing protein [Acidimicrobiales bacterium]|nr:WxL domain-containing protein [Acidimicrobiales bacterium]